MVISMREEAGSFDPERFPEWVWVSGLFGRVTHNLVLRNELKQAYDVVERELKVVADIQRLALAASFAEDSEPRAGHVLSHFALGGRRLLRLLPAAGRTMGNSGGGRQRPWNTGGRDDGDHAQPGAQSTRAGRSARDHARSFEPAVVDALHGRQRSFRHRVLCDL